MGIMNKGVLYALWDYEPQHGDELPLREGDCLAVLRREDEEETEWWWARLQDQEGYVPRNLLGVSVSSARRRILTFGRWRVHASGHIFRVGEPPGTVRVPCSWSSCAPHGTRGWTGQGTAGGSHLLSWI